MKKRVRRYEEISPIEFLLLRENLGMKKYRKRGPRDAKKREILLKLALRMIEEAEKTDYIKVKERVRKVKLSL